MLLSYKQLKRHIQHKVLWPVPNDHVNASSIDVTLGDTVMWERTGKLIDGRPVMANIVSLRHREPVDWVEHEIPDEGYLLSPGAFILANTAETFNMPDWLSAEFRLKSSAARMGLSHALAVWVDPGFHGSTLTLELHNLTQAHTIRLLRGDRIGQMIFHKHETVPAHASYAQTGRYNNDLKPTAAKVDKDPTI